MTKSKQIKSTFAFYFQNFFNSRSPALWRELFCFDLVVDTKGKSQSNAGLFAFGEKMENKICKLENCDTKHCAQGFCKKHYLIAYRTGEIAIVQKKGLPDLERFWQYVSKTESCWNWLGSLASAGYGVFATGKRSNNTFKQIGAHVFAYTLAKGEIPAKYHIDHLCRNPKCVNPDHLEAVTPRINTLRGVGVTARNFQKTHCKRGHILQGENLYRIPSGGRACKTCKAKWKSERLESQASLLVR